ncbi:MAG: C4-type zinc ribbon domain-containing protein [Kiritimatiellae bacterium]|nr:C4-type zinc ribbon domain-containing protein [Kiritimatiellia bacterium]MDD4341715.1 C4-type zinc ribbon domain-containing protein [Kiritimatiellia bacterium]
MAKVIEQLLVVQACDQDIQRLRKEMDDIPRRQQQIESRLAAQQQGVETAEREVLEKQARIKNLEGEIETNRAQIQKYRDQQLQIKTNEGYKALEKEIATTQTAIRKLEDEALEGMETVEAAKDVLDERREALAKEQVRVDEEVKIFLERSTGLDSECEEKMAERKVLAEAIDPTWLARYERLFAKQGDAAIALVEHGTCGRCHMKLPPAQVVGARKADTLTVCDFCGRMLYHSS